MKNIIPFKKDVIFKTNLSEITSISLENTLNLKDDTISGDFIVSGEYKVSDNSTTVEPFSLKLPFEIILDDRFDTKKAIVDIDDFYYEIVNDNTLSVSIDVLVDHLSEKPLIGELVDVTPERFDLTKEIESEDDSVNKEDLDEKRCIEEEEVKEANIEEVENNRNEEVQEKINSIFNNGSFESDVYVTYNVFIVRDGDTLDSIMEKYNVTEEELKKYNDLSNLQLGDKLIIPNSYERN
jgi:LysM repeat protein